jgi:protein-histidine pros-kinase
VGLRLKFNLVLLLVFVVGLSGTAYVSHTLLHRNAREEVFRNAGLMLETAMAIRKYTVDQVRPNLEAHAEGVFVPQSVPAYAATETVAELRKKYPDYSYKEATLNPINPRNRVTDWEADLVQEFRNNLQATELYGERDTATGRSLFIARPIQVKTEACLSCHSSPAAAPASMVKQYGEVNGYGWKLNEIVGAQVVSVPMSLPIRNADRAFQAFMISLITIFVIVFLFLNVMLSWLIIRPVSTMSQMAEQVSTGNFKVPEFDERGKDEIAVLGNSFNRMRRSLQKAMKMIEG